MLLRYAGALVVSQDVLAVSPFASAFADSADWTGMQECCFPFWLRLESQQKETAKQRDLDVILASVIFKLTCKMRRKPLVREMTFSMLDGERRSGCCEERSSSFPFCSLHSFY